jgi:hypothetical protein
MEFIVENPQVALSQKTGRWLLYERMFKGEERRCTIDLFSPRSAKIFSSSLSKKRTFCSIYICEKMKEGSKRRSNNRKQIMLLGAENIVFFHVHLRKVLRDMRLHVFCVAGC